LIGIFGSLKHTKVTEGPSNWLFRPNAHIDEYFDQS
jgi:hypothetical protein